MTLISCFCHASARWLSRMNPAVYQYMLPLHYILLSYLFEHTLFNLLQTNTWSVLSPTGVGIDWLWLLLSWPCDWNAHWRLVDAVVVLIKERDALRDVVGPRSVTVAVKVRREEGIIRPLHSVLVSWPFSQTVRTSSSGQVAHECVVLCKQAEGGCFDLRWQAYLLASKETATFFFVTSSFSPESLRGQKAHCPPQAMPYRQQHSVYVVLRPSRGSAHMLSPSSRCQHIFMLISWSVSGTSGW